jgi:uncharacterized membrane protein YphA (DoxX/SURF4 family)
MKLRSLIGSEDRRAIDLGLCILRVCFGLSLASIYGFGKLTAAWSHIFQGQEWRFMRMVTMLGFPVPAVFATASALVESFGAVLLAVGLLTRVNAGLIACNMIAAVCWHLRFVQSPELAALYLFAALALVASGGGKYSLDSLSR